MKVVTMSRKFVLKGALCCVAQLHVTERQSIPNLSAAGSQEAGLPSLIEFDSLKSLPQRDYLQPHYESQQQLQGI